MKNYTHFETVKAALGFRDAPIENIIKKKKMNESQIALIDKKLSECQHLMTHFPIGYAYEENKTAYYRIALSEHFQLLRERPAGSSILDFIAMDTGDTVAYLEKLCESIHQMLLEKANNLDEKGIIRLNISDVIDTAITSNLIPLDNGNFFLYLVNCAFLQFIIELTIYSFCPMIAITNYEKVLGGTAKYAPEERKKLELPDEDGIYNLADFQKYGIQMTAYFIDYERELLSNDLSMVLDHNDIMVAYDALQYLYLLESNEQLKGSYTNTNFNVHLMPVGIHDFNHKSVVEKIIVDYMNVREMYDLNSIQDWFRYEFLCLAKGNILYKQCKNCGKFFIPSGRSDSEYCDRIDSTSGKTCKEVGAINTFAKKHENDGIHQAYTKAYRRMDSRKRTMYISKSEFTQWSKTAREKRKLCETGQITLEEFQAWLDESKCR